jgi:hypothetical protein
VPTGVAQFSVGNTRTAEPSSPSGNYTSTNGTNAERAATSPLGSGLKSTKGYYYGASYQTRNYKNDVLPDTYFTVFGTQAFYKQTDPLDAQQNSPTTAADAFQQKLNASNQKKAPFSGYMGQVGVKVGMENSRWFQHIDASISQQNQLWDSQKANITRTITNASLTNPFYESGKWLYENVLDIGVSIGNAHLSKASYSGSAVDSVFKSSGTLPNNVVTTGWATQIHLRKILGKFAKTDDSPTSWVPKNFGYQQTQTLSSTPYKTQTVQLIGAVPGTSWTYQVNATRVSPLGSDKTINNEVYMNAAVNIPMPSGSDSDSK